MLLFQINYLKESTISKVRGGQGLPGILIFEYETITISFI
jgi:hypothetical protein